MRKKEIIQDLLVGLIVSVISLALGYWLNGRHSLPVIEINDNGGLYGFINGRPVGSIFVGNSGYKTDKNISIKLDDEIESSSISIPSASIDYDVKNSPDGTIITLRELRPSETAQIFFSPKDQTVKYFEVLDTISDSNNIYDLYYVDWWNVSIELKILIAFLMLISCFVGLYIPRRLTVYKSTT